MAHTTLAFGPRAIYHHVVRERRAERGSQSSPRPGPAHTVRYGGWRITLRVESVEWVGEEAHQKGVSR
jgi:hypothetical protein